MVHSRRSTAPMCPGNCFPAVPLSIGMLLLSVGMNCFFLLSPEASIQPYSALTEAARAMTNRAYRHTLEARNGPPPVPTKGYIITIKPNSTRYHQAVQAINGIGITDLVKVDGLVADKHQFAHGSWKQEDTLKLGLTRSHMKAWQQLINDDVEEAWVFEDDVVFHDDWDALFPKYWQQVPGDYDFVWVGSCAACGPWPDEQHSTVISAPKCFPWCIHTYILTKGVAERLILNAEYKFARATQNRWAPFAHENFTTLWYLDEFDISADNLVGSQYRWLTPAADKHKWVTFTNTEAVPAQWLGVTWVQGHWYASECHCWCDAPDRRDCIGNGTIPVEWSQHGLAFQQSCSKLEDPNMVGIWREEVAAYKVEKGLSALRTTCHGWPR